MQVMCRIIAGIISILALIVLSPILLIFITGFIIGELIVVISE